MLSSTYGNLLGDDFRIRIIKLTQQPLMLTHTLTPENRKQKVFLDFLWNSTFVYEDKSNIPTRLNLSCIPIIIGHLVLTKRENPSHKHTHTHTPLSHHFMVCLLTLSPSFFSPPPFSCQLKTLKRQLVKPFHFVHLPLFFFPPLILSPYHSSAPCRSKAWKVTRVRVCNFIITCGEF